MEIILLAFLKKFSFEASGQFWPENGMSSKFRIHTKGFFETLHDEKGKRYMKISLMVFLKEKYHFGEMA